MRVVVIGGEIRTHGENASAIQFGRFRAGAMTNVADVGEDGYRKHTAAVYSQVFGAVRAMRRASIYGAVAGSSTDRVAP